MGRRKRQKSKKKELQRVYDNLVAIEARLLTKDRRFFLHRLWTNAADILGVAGFFKDFWDDEHELFEEDLREREQFCES